jgi:uncharacterized membrane protein YqaE (UPF0057 family)
MITKRGIFSIAVMVALLLSLMAPALIYATKPDSGPIIPTFY